VSAGNRFLAAASRIGCVWLRCRRCLSSNHVWAAMGRLLCNRRVRRLWWRFSVRWHGRRSCPALCQDRRRWYCGGWGSSWRNFGLCSRGRLCLCRNWMIQDWLGGNCGCLAGRNRLCRHHGSGDGVPLCRRWLNWCWLGRDCGRCWR
jgi:hypothetical protein